jgi:hypothetical protein
MSTPSQYLISAIIRTGDLQTALDKGITADVVPGFGSEWARITNSYRDYGRTPDKAWMKEHFPDFRIKAVDNVAHYADEVMAEQQNKSAVKLAQDIIKEREQQGAGDVVATARSINAIIDRYANGLHSSNSFVRTSLTAWPEPQLDQAALHGIAGSIVRSIEPHTEADRVGLLLSLLTGFGNAVGPGPHVMADSATHTAKLFVSLVGRTSRARKGTSWANVKAVLEQADLGWLAEAEVSGLSSGEGLIERVKVEDFTDPKDPERVLVVEEEFGRSLKVMSREANILSAVIREAWSGERLQVLNRKSNRLYGRGYISILGHITMEELQHLLSTTDVENGFANRFLWAFVRRSKKLPSGNGMDQVQLSGLGKQLRTAMDKARKVQRRGIVKSCGSPVPHDHAATSWVFSSGASLGRSTSFPFSNLAPARTRATRCGPLTARQRS